MIEALVYWVTFTVVYVAVYAWQFLCQNLAADLILASVVWVLWMCDLVEVRL